MSYMFNIAPCLKRVSAPFESRYMADKFADPGGERGAPVPEAKICKEVKGKIKGRSTAAS